MIRLRSLVPALSFCACRGVEPIELPPNPSSSSSAELTLEAPELPPGHSVASLGLGLSYTCALLRGGTVKCWGSDDHGVLGQDGAHADVSDPSLIGPIDFGDDRKVVQLSAGWRHVCVLFEDARARCWGNNESGQLGQGNVDDYGDDPGESLNSLEDIALEDVIRVSAGVSNTCVIVREGEGAGGTVHCFGSDLGGGIGDPGAGDFGDDEPVSALRAVSLPAPATEIAAGDAVSCARLSNGAVHCWGQNVFGSLGIGATRCNIADEQPCDGVRRDPTGNAVQGLGSADVRLLQLNQAHACVVDNGGELRCWGRNDQSRAGYPHIIYGEVLGLPPGSVRLGNEIRVVSVGLGIRHGCAVDASGSVRCWGESGPQLGYGVPQQDGLAGIGGISEPAEQYEAMEKEGVVQLGDTDAEPGNDRALRVFSGGRHNCVILASGGVRCWGSNERGELGYGDVSRIGSIGDRDSPAQAYALQGRYDVCIVPENPSACSD